MIDHLIKATRDGEWAKASDLLYKHWVSTCPSAYSSVAPPWEAVPDEQKINKDLLYPLAAMFCGGEEHSQDGGGDACLKGLCKAAGLKDSALSGLRPGQICGKRLKNGEANYSCRECATDNTCVLCHDCLVNSEHANHRYKIHTSTGSGYCDCGDPEAWSSHFACRLHMVEEGDASNTTPTLSIPPQLRLRIHSLSLMAVKFAVNMLCWSEIEAPHFLLPPPPNANSEEGTFTTVLFNDESHSYDSVIRALEISIHCSTAEAMRLATIVDREGRTPVVTSTKEVCDTAKHSLKRRTMRDYNRRTQKTGPLEVRVHRSEVVALQQLALRLLNWLSAQVEVFPPLAEVLSEVLLYHCIDEGCVDGFGRGSTTSSITTSLDPPCGHISNCVKMILHDRNLWKAARAAVYQLLMSTVLLNLRHKHQLGQLLVRHYEAIYTSFLDDDHEHNCCCISMAVQIFTVPTIARALVIEDDAIRTLISTLLGFTSQYITVSPSNGRLQMFNFSSDSHPYLLRRALYIFTDLQYLLSSVPSPTDWSQPMRTSFCRGAQTFLEFLSHLNGMDEVKRQSVEHQLMESEWETAFNILIRGQAVISLMLAWARTDAQVHQTLFKSCLSLIQQKTREMPEFTTPYSYRVEVNGLSAYCIDFDVSRSPLSIHQSLWRFAAGLFAADPSILKWYGVEGAEGVNIKSQDRSLAPINCKGLRTLLMEMPLRVIVLHAQSSAMLWRRNGFSLVNQIHNYSSQLCRVEMYDRDILMLQAVGALSEPNAFLIRVVERFGLIKWAEVGFEDQAVPVLSATTPSTPSSTPEELSKISVLLAEEMYHLLIILLSERHLPGVSDCTPIKTLQREVVSLLCTGPKPFSQIEKIVPNDPAVEKVSLDDLVREVAVFRRPAGSSATGLFHLKEEHLPHYSPFFFHYTRSMVSQAEQHQKRERAKLSREMRACPPPPAPAFQPFFRPLLRLMHCEMFVKLLRIVYERALKRSRYTSEGLLHRALFLTGMALNEEEQQKEFLERAEQQGLLHLMIKLQQQSQLPQHSQSPPQQWEHEDLLWWTIEKYKSAVERQRGGIVNPASTTATNTTTTIEGRTAEEKALERASMAARKKELAKEWMEKMQRSFQKRQTEPAAEEEGKRPVNKSPVPPVEEDEDEEVGVLESGASGAGYPVCCGPNKTTLASRSQRRISCILCQEHALVSFGVGSKAIVTAGFVQPSRLFARQPFSQPLSTPSTPNDIYAPLGMEEGVSVSTCTHTMHYDCHTQLIQSIQQRERARPRQQTLHSRIINLEDGGEYQCPLCKRLSNCALPLLAPTMSMGGGVIGMSEDRPAKVEPFSEWIHRLREALHPQTDPTTTTALQKKKGHHSRKRSHSERSIPKESTNSMGGSTASMAETEPLDVFLPITQSDTSLSSGGGGGGAVGGAEPEHGSFLHHLLNYAINFSSSRGGALKRKQRMDRPNLPHTLPDHRPVLALIRVLASSGQKVKTPKERSDSAQLLNGVVDVLKATSFLLLSTSTVLQVEKKPLFGGMSTRQRDCITIMARLAAVMPFNCQPSTIRLLVGRLLLPLLPSPSHTRKESSPSFALSSALEIATLQGSSTPPDSSSSSSSMRMFNSKVGIMDVDMLTLAVQLAICIGWTWVDGKQEILPASTATSTSKAGVKHKIADGSVDELYAIQLTLIGHIFQIIVGVGEEEHSQKGKPMPHDLNTDSLNELIAIARQGARPLNIGTVIEKVQAGVLSFLRPLAILYHAITLVPPPECLKDPSLSGAEPLCRYLGLPRRLDQLLEGPEVIALFKGWAAHLPPMTLARVELPLKINILIDLPKSYAELVNEAGKFRCPSVTAEDVSNMVPALCLICGTMLCSQSYCCQKTLNNENVGACTYHMSQCGGTSGIFLRVRDCQLMLMTSYARGCNKPAPYVDEFGETDPGFRRGNPMHLSEDMYWKVQRLWLYQEIGEEIVNQIEINSRNLALEWNHI